MRSKTDGPSRRGRGERLTPAEKRQLRRVLRDHGVDWSNRQIAQRVGVSDKTVARFRWNSLIDRVGDVDPVPADEDVPTVQVIINLRFNMAEATARVLATPWASEQFDDSIRDRGVEGLREAVTTVGNMLLRDQSTVDLWNRRLPRRRSR